MRLDMFDKHFRSVIDSRGTPFVCGWRNLALREALTDQFVVLAPLCLDRFTRCLPRKLAPPLFIPPLEEVVPWLLVLDVPVTDTIQGDKFPQPPNAANLFDDAYSLLGDRALEGTNLRRSQRQFCATGVLSQVLD